MIFDIIVLAALLISSLIAFLRGLIREVLTILGVIGGTFAAVTLGPKLSPFIRAWLGHKSHEATQNPAAETDKHADRLFGILPYDMAADFIAYGGVFVVVVIILSIVSHLMSGFARKVGLGAVDRTLGVLFGIARAIVLLALLYLPIYLLVDSPTRDDWFQDSHTRVYVEATSHWISGYLPKNMAEDMNASAEKASASMAGATREKLEQMNLLKMDAKDKANETAGNVKDKGQMAGQIVRESGEKLKETIQNGAAAIKNGIQFDSAHQGYDNAERTQMNGLIGQESKGQNGH